MKFEYLEDQPTSQIYSTNLLGSVRKRRCDSINSRKDRRAADHSSKQIVQELRHVGTCNLL